MAENLLCTETKSLCFDDLDDDSLNIGQQNIETNSKSMSLSSCRSEGLIDLPCLSEENFGFMMQKEKDYLPKDDYLMRLRSGVLDLSMRKEALDWIWKAHIHYGFGVMSFCLSINYLDRFLSLYQLPNNDWTVQLLAVTCLSIAAKMEEINVPSTVDLQVGDPKFSFVGKTIQRMELSVLSTLNWRMQAYTPCTFIDYFVRKMNGDQTPTGHLISRSIQVILSTIKGIDFLEFRYSEIAAAIALSVSREIQANENFFIHLQKGRVLKCLELIQHLTLVGGTLTTTTIAITSVPQSPIRVLEVECFGNKTDKRTIGSCPTSSHNKRRKL